VEKPPRTFEVRKVMRSRAAGRAVEMSFWSFYMKSIKREGRATWEVSLERRVEENQPKP